jgi:hypothetical protein
MAISALSSVGSDYVQLFRIRGSGASESLRGADRGAGVLARVQAIPALAGREDAEGPAKDAETAGASPDMATPRVEGEGREREKRVFGVDPRGPEAILGAKVPLSTPAVEGGRPESEAAGRPEPNVAGRAPEPKAAGRSVEREGAVAVIRASESRRAEDASEARRTESASRKREAGSRLDDLLGQKSAMERKQAEEKGSRSTEVLAELSQLKARDGEVRAHEAAHIATGGRYITGGASYTYQRGPDGGQYAVGGEVGIDSSPASGKPEETVQKMRVVRAAALAPSEPSGADLSVAAAASQAEAAAVAEISQRNAEEAARSYSRESARGRAAGDKESRNSGLDMVA